MGHLYLTGKIWWMKYYPKGSGQPVYESTKKKIDEKKEAKELLARREGGSRKATSRVLFRDVLADYILDLQANNRKDVRSVMLKIESHIDPALGHLPAPQLTLLSSTPTLIEGSANRLPMPLLTGSLLGCTEHSPLLHMPE